MKGSDERQTTVMRRTQANTIQTRSGFMEMVLLKTAPSGTTGGVAVPLAIAAQPISASITAEWSYPADTQDSNVDFNKTRQRVRERMITTFAQYESLNLAEIVQAMAKAALNEVEGIDEVSVQLRNRPLLFPAGPNAGQGQPSHLLVPADKPGNVFEATAKRSSSPPPSATGA